MTTITVSDLHPAGSELFTDNLINKISIIEEVSEKELDLVLGGKTTVVSCNTNGTYTYTNGKTTWNAKPFWMWW
jgi:hypothetical protein